MGTLYNKKAEVKPCTNGAEVSNPKKGTLTSKELLTKRGWSCMMSKQETGDRKDRMEGVCCHM